MKNLSSPPVILPKQFKLILAYMRSSVSLYRYAIYHELLAYPEMVAKKLRKMKFKDVSLKDCTILDVSVLEPTMKRFLERHIKRYGITKPEELVFNFSRQRAHVVWQKALEVSGISKEAGINDLKEAFNKILRENYPDYEGRLNFKS